MKFTYGSLINLYGLLKDNGYKFCDYKNADLSEKAVIIRHDIDMDETAALKVAELERELGIKANYFFLLSGDFYNIFSAETNRIIKKVYGMGHNIGLHFDETRYTLNCAEDYSRRIMEERAVMEQALDLPVQAVAMHRPSKEILGKDIALKDMENAYSSRFFNLYSYFSDSRMCWKANIEDEISSGRHSKVQLLVHPIWYRETPAGIKEVLTEFMEKKKRDAFEGLKSNISRLEDVFDKEEFI